MLEQLEKRLQMHQSRAINSNLPEAAVLIPLLFKDSAPEPELIFTRRARHMSTHSGEVAFPGGKRDDSDPSLLWTALRESQEEINLEPGSVQVLGQLRSVISRFGLEVTPFVGIIPPDSQLVANTQELDRIFSVPLGYFLDHDNLQFDQWHGTNKTWKMPAYAYDEYLIWGLTAIMLVEFLNVGLGANIPLDTPQFSADYAMSQKKIQGV
ncbi:MAG: CoA pyrophosphatase [Endozoicomonas sp.]